MLMLGRKIALGKKYPISNTKKEKNVHKEIKKKIQTVNASNFFFG